MFVREDLSGTKMVNWQEAAKACFEILCTENEMDREKEHVWCVGLGSDSEVVYIELVALGDMNKCLASPREIFRTALWKNVVGIVLVHNHVSDKGVPSPSAEDLAVTGRIIVAGDLMGIPLLDSVIVSADGEGISLKSMPVEEVEKITGVDAPEGVKALGRLLQDLTRSLKMGGPLPAGVAVLGMGRKGGDGEGGGYVN